MPDTSMVNISRGATMILEVAASDGLPDPRTVYLFNPDYDPCVEIRVREIADVHRWAQWLGYPRSVTANYLPSGELKAQVSAEKYEQPVRVFAIELAETEPA